MKRFIISLVCILLIDGIAMADAQQKDLKTAVLYYKDGNYTGCIDIMDQIVKADPGNALAHYYLAISYVQIGQSTQANKEYKKVISLSKFSTGKVCTKGHRVY